ncbi:hypothetical protein CC86DRAFT_429849 [Ophiobolus disseminans]|uniref:Uncharacterized protein n=1 Tax=Ophiobolus disseminans TaxID=1469910 RepID=A0A6A6ZEZ8_9PLEO|nr:hypothetical protein CC86DRAFT_429849 [Ophiobolus disseminans]
MQAAPVTYHTFRTFFISNEATLLSIPRLVRDFSYRNDLHSRLATIFMVATMCFILAFPIFGSAMTGYSANVEPLIAGSDGRYLPFKDVNSTFYAMLDSERLGWAEKYTVGASSKSNFQEEVKLLTGTWLDRCVPSQIPSDDRTTCEMVNNITEYVKQYGLYRQSNTSSVFMGIHLPSPSLNIEAFYLSDLYRAHYNWTEHFSYTKKNFFDKRSMAWMIDGELGYSLANHGSCQATKVALQHLNREIH